MLKCCKYDLKLDTERLVNVQCAHIFVKRKKKTT